MPTKWKDTRKNRKKKGMKDDGKINRKRWKDEVT